MIDVAKRGGAGPISTSATPDSPLVSPLTYREILDQQTEMICRFTPDLVITYANQAYASQYGHTGDSILGHFLLEFFPEEAHGFATEMVRRLGPHNPVNRHDNEVVSSDGVRKWFQWTDTVTLNGEGVVTEIQAVGRDVTDSHVLAEGMRRSEERFRRAFESAPIGMAVLDASAVVQRANLALASFLEIDDLEKLVDRSLSDMIASGDTAGFDFDWPENAREVRFMLPDGSVRFAELSCTPFDVDENGQTLWLVQVVDLQARKRAEAELAHAALHDVLTGLPNRALLLDRLEHALRVRRSTGTVAVLFCDLDQFKLVNDSFGHDVGDALLRSVANRLSSTVRGHDTLARFGGDEFVILAEGLDSECDAQELARRLTVSLAEPIDLGVAAVSVGISVGIALAQSGNDDNVTACEPGELIRRADLAMYAAKKSARPRVAVYASSLEQQSSAKLSLQTDLSRAMKNDEFVPVFQPLVDARGHAIGVEALVRWDRGDGTLILPAQFLAVAEDMGLIVPMGRRVMELACEQAVAWSKTSLRPIQAWVNVCGRELTDGGFVPAVLQCLVATGLPAQQLCIELTEWTVLTDVGVVASIMEELQAVGVRFALADFGTGYSALDFLRRFPLDALKIDGTFVGGLLKERSVDRALVTAIANLGAELRLTVVGEGVEQIEHAHILRGLGVPLLQGYGLAPPALPEALTEWFTPGSGRLAA